MANLGEHLHGGAVDGAEIARVREVLLFEEPERQRKLTRFFALLILAAAIATFGLLADSVATVIGAMIVAPLMLPIMGVAFGVGLGDRKIIRNSLTMSILGILTAIAMGFLLTWAIRSLIDVEANTQIMVRTAPRLIDLCAALATGLAYHIVGVERVLERPAVCAFIDWLVEEARAEPAPEVILAPNGLAPAGAQSL